jgi:uncharacterized protein
MSSLRVGSGALALRLGTGVLALIAGSLATPAFSQSLQPIPKLAARATDLTGTLTAEQQSALEDKLSAFEARKGSQVAVLVVPTTHPEDIAAFSIRVAEQWRLGRRKIDDGALLIIAKNDRELRIEVGKGLEGALPDVIAHRIISESIVPLLRQGDFYAGIAAGLAVFLGSAVLRSLFGRGLGALMAGAATAAVLYIAGTTLVIAALAGLIACLFCLVSGFSGGGTWSSYPRAGGWGGGFSSAGGGLTTGGGFGGGGFGGGGGGFNGGGASGRW